MTNADNILILSRKKKIYRKKTGYIFEFEMPDFAVNFGKESDAAADAATALCNYLKANIGDGRDATGAQHTPSAATIKWRKSDMHPPQTTRQKAGPFLRKTKTGKTKVVTQKQRWQERYPDGRGSLGGNISFVDSGHLFRGLSVEVSGSSAFVTVPPARARAINAIHKGEYGAGNKPPIPLLCIRPEPLDAALAKRLQQSFSSKAIGRLIRGGTNVLAGLALKGAAAALGDAMDSGGQTEQTTETSGEATTSA